MDGSQIETEFSFGLSDDELTLSLVATGLLTLVQDIESGKPFTFPYPSSLQRGLNRLVLLGIKNGQVPPKSIPDLITWCHRAFNTWPFPLQDGLLDPGDVFLGGGIPTDICEAWAHPGGDVEADLREREFFQSLKITCMSTGTPEAYVKLRELFIRQPVLTNFELAEKRNREPALYPVVDYIDHAYISAPISHLKDGHFYCCSQCNSLLFVDHQGDLFCENYHCRSVGPEIVGRVLDPKDEVFWLRREIRRYWTFPGIPELRLARTLRELGIEVTLWPDFDKYDLRVILPNGEVWAVDVKDWAKPALLARHVKSFPQEPCWTQAFFVFPEERRRQRSDYVRAFVNYSKTRGILNRRTHAVFERDFVKKVKHQLQ